MQKSIPTYDNDADEGLDNVGPMEKSPDKRPSMPHCTSFWANTRGSKKTDVYQNGVSDFQSLKGHAASSQEVINSIVDDPICCGYLLAFCESEHSSENLCFLMEVDRFRDMIYSNDRDTWVRSWKDIDETLSSQQEDSISIKWPSLRLSESVVKTHVLNIWDTFLADEAYYQICVPAHVLRNTRRRMELLAHYGPEVFQEALQEPNKTLRRDTLPRFRASPLFLDLSANMESLQVLPISVSLAVEPPATELTQAPVKEGYFSLEEILQDQVLYLEFHAYLVKSVSSENLLCVRMIDIFHEIVESGDNVRAGEQAWRIYRYFVAPGSCYEVSLFALHRKQIMIGLAKPTSSMFSELRKSAHSMLTVSFNYFRFTDEYRGLTARLHEVRRRQKPKDRFSSMTPNWLSLKFSAGSSSA